MTSDREQMFDGGFATVKETAEYRGDVVTFLQLLSKYRPLHVRQPGCDELNSCA